MSVAGFESASAASRLEDTVDQSPNKDSSPNGVESNSLNGESPVTKEISVTSPEIKQGVDGTASSSEEGFVPIDKPSPQDDEAKKEENPEASMPGAKVGPQASTSLPTHEPFLQRQMSDEEKEAVDGLSQALRITSADREDHIRKSLKEAVKAGVGETPQAAQARAALYQSDRLLSLKTAIQNADPSAVSYSADDKLTPALEEVVGAAVLSAEAQEVVDLAGTVIDIRAALQMRLRNNAWDNPRTIGQVVEWIQKVKPKIPHCQVVEEAEKVVGKDQAQEQEVQKRASDLVRRGSLNLEKLPRRSILKTRSQAMHGHGRAASFGELDAEVTKKTVRFAQCVIDEDEQRHAPAPVKVSRLRGLRARNPVSWKRPKSLLKNEGKKSEEKKRSFRPTKEAALARLAFLNNDLPIDSSPPTSPSQGSNSECGDNDDDDDDDDDDPTIVRRTPERKNVNNLQSPPPPEDTETSPKIEGRRVLLEKSVRSLGRNVLSYPGRKKKKVSLREKRKKKAAYAMEILELRHEVKMLRKKVLDYKTIVRRYAPKEQIPFDDQEYNDGDDEDDNESNGSIAKKQGEDDGDDELTDLISRMVSRHKKRVDGDPGDEDAEAAPGCDEDQLPKSEYGEALAVGAVALLWVAAFCLTATHGK